MTRTTWADSDSMKRHITPQQSCSHRHDSATWKVERTGQKKHITASTYKIQGAHKRQSEAARAAQKRTLPLDPLPCKTCKNHTARGQLGQQGKSLLNCSLHLASTSNRSNSQKTASALKGD